MKYRLRSDHSVTCEVFPSERTNWVSFCVYEPTGNVVPQATTQFLFDKQWEPLLDETPGDITDRIHQCLKSIGVLNAPLAIIPDSLFDEAKHEAQRWDKEHSGICGNIDDDVLIDVGTVLVGETKARQELLRYRKVQAAMK